MALTAAAVALVVLVLVSASGCHHPLLNRGADCPSRRERLEWIEKVGQEIREKEKKTDRSVPTVVRRWAGAKDVESGRVTLEAEQGTARFSVVATGEIICEDTVECVVPIQRAIRVRKRGYRALTLSAESLYDHCETRWHLTLGR